MNNTNAAGLVNFILNIQKENSKIVDSKGNITLVLQEENSESGRAWGRYEVRISPVSNDMGNIEQYQVEVGQTNYKDGSFHPTSQNVVPVNDFSYLTK